MRILPALCCNKNFIQGSKVAHTKFVSKNQTKVNPQAHKYTGVASADLAYASMFDSAIAKDLKLMGLI